MRERTPEEVYSTLTSEGLYKETESNSDEIRDIKNLTLEDLAYLEVLAKQKNPNWRSPPPLNYLHLNNTRKKV